VKEKHLVDFEEKVDLLREILRKQNADGVLLGLQCHFSWLTGGRGFIGTASVPACATLLVTKSKVCLIAENIEAQRLYREQLDENPFIEVYEYPWQEGAARTGILDSLCGGKKILTENDLSAELFAARTKLSSYDIERYREICGTTAQELEKVCKTLKAGMTEYELAGKLAERFWANNLEPITLLVGFDERALSYRHPVPAGAVLKNYALVAVCARRCGLIASATRLVCLKRDEKMIERQKAAAYVDAVLCANTVPGVTIGSVFSKAVEAYAEKGWKDEWKYHHQGGLTGYLPRELKGTAGEGHVIRAGEAYGWNPSVQGAKSENTILVTENGFESLTHTGDYPYLTYEMNGKKVVTEDILILEENT